LAIKERLYGTDHEDVALTLQNLGLLYVSQGQPDKAEPFYRRTLSIREKVMGPRHPELARYLEELAGVLRKLHRDEEAAGLETRAYDVRLKRS
jgi:hypothetical protein